jgi:RNA polymerase sigma-70 factor (ECF subfamily)
MLKTLCGFSVGEIAHAFLVPETTVEKRLARAHAELRTHRDFLDAATGPRLSERLASVQAALYLLFNEGYHGSHPEHAVREDLCGEAMRLCALLAEHPAGDEPRTHALLALFCFHAARLATRTDGSGALVLLAEQDRGLWDAVLVARGEQSLSRAATGDALSAYHVEAAIASCHAAAPSFAETDWRAIVDLYDVLLRIRPSVVVALNRAIAVGYADGPARGLEALDAIARESSLSAYPFLDAARGDFLRALGRADEAGAAFRRAIARARNGAERALLERKLRAESAPG